MKLFGLNFGRKKSSAGAFVTFQPAGGMSYFLGPLMESFAGSWSRHITVERRENLLAFSAVYSCVSLIADDISKLRLKLMRTDGKIWTEVTSGHSALAVLRRPNGYMTRIQFLAYWISSLLLYGNAYALIDRNNRREVVALYPVDPRMVKAMVASDGSVYYAISADNLARIPGGEAMLYQEEIVHDRMTTLWHPLMGVSPIYACGASATQGVRIQNNSATFFENMSRPSGQLTAPGTIADETAKRLKEQFENNFSGSNIGRLFIGGDGLKYEAMTIPAHDAQLIEQLRWTVEDVARAFHIPNHKLGIGTPTITNVIALNQDYYSQCLQTRIEAIEELLGHAFGLPENMRIELDLDGLLRMDPVSQIDVLQKGVAAAIMAPNEARAKLNLPPVDGGEYPLAQQQNWSLASLADRPSPTEPTPGGGSAKRREYSFTAKNAMGIEETVYFRTQLEMHAFMDAYEAAEQKKLSLSERTITK